MQPNLLQALSFCNAGKPASCPLQHLRVPESHDEAQASGSAEQQEDRVDALVEGMFCVSLMLTAAVPLPEVCNNPHCESLGGVSEAAAAVKACGGCGARYCSRECQESHWKVHRRACRRLRGARA
jgi:hypothetical protein